MDRLLRMVPGYAAARIQMNIWRAQMRELRPFYPVVLPVLAWVFVRSYRDEQERLRLEYADAVLRPEKRVESNRPSDA